MLCSGALCLTAHLSPSRDGMEESAVPSKIGKAERLNVVTYTHTRSAQKGSTAVAEGVRTALQDEMVSVILT